jgi:ribonuclease I
MRWPALSVVCIVGGVGAGLVARAEARQGDLHPRRAQSDPEPSSDPDTPCGAAGDFDYHVLEMLWRPQYCLQQGNETWPGCVLPGQVDRLTVHGLWPSYTRAPPVACSVPWPQFCPDRPPFDLTALFQDQALLTELQMYWPDVQNLTVGENAQYEWFWQHAWERHGVCTVADQVAFFRNAVGLRSALAIPDEIASNLGGYADAAKINAAVGGFASCSSVDGNSTLLELRGISVCYTPAPGSALAGDPIDCPLKQYACPVDGTKILVRDWPA